MVHDLTTPTPKTTKNPTTKRFVSPAIGLDRPALKDKLNKTQCLTFKLRSTPADENSSTYELTVPFFRSGTPEELLLFIKSLKKVIVGQAITSGPNQYSLARHLLQGDALAAFEKAAPAQTSETIATFKECLEELKKHIFPQRALANQKRYMRRFLRKPRDMSVREFAARLNEINEYLSDFPPSNENNKLLMDELMDIAEFSVPATWQKTMIMHGFDPANHTIQEFIEFCERIEFSEGNERQAQLKETKSQTDQNGSTTGGKRRAKSSERGESKKAKATGKWCPLHEIDTHDANQCKVLLSQAKKMRAQWEVSKGKYSGDPARYSSSSTSKSKTSTKESFTTNIKDYIQKSVKEAFLSEKKTRSENETFNIEDFEEMELSDDASSNTKE